MLQLLGRWSVLTPWPVLPYTTMGDSVEKAWTWSSSSFGASRCHCNRLQPNTSCPATRRSIRYDDPGDIEEEEDDDYGHNEEISMLESYSQSARGEAVIVHATVDDDEVEVLIYKGFSSSLSYGTSPDLSRSILPARAKIKYLDRIKGPFDPSNIEYIEKAITWERFRDAFLS